MFAPLSRYLWQFHILINGKLSETRGDPPGDPRTFPSAYGVFTFGCFQMLSETRGDPPGDPRFCQILMASVTKGVCSHWPNYNTIKRSGCTPAPWKFQNFHKGCGGNIKVHVVGARSVIFFFPRPTCLSYIFLCQNGYVLYRPNLTSAGCVSWQNKIWFLYVKLVSAKIGLSCLGFIPWRGLSHSSRVVQR